MKRRHLGRTRIEVSEVGLGCEHLQDQPEAMVNAVIRRALEHQINFFDVFMSQPEVRTHIGRALTGHRHQVVIQGHIGAAWLDGQYARSRDRDICRRFFNDLLQRLNTDYIDIGMLHFSDTLADWQQLVDQGIVDYARQLKEQGLIRAVGISSHDPSTARKAVESGAIDVLMFSMNPAFDILPESTELEALFQPETFRSDDLHGLNPGREALYRTCEANGTAITVMKGYAAGNLLHEQRSPFGRALSPSQCIHYALTRPAVASFLAGCRSPEEVDAAAAYAQATDQERDFSVLLSQTRVFSLRGHCMYCNHCLPCPANIDIAQVIKYLDLYQATAEDPTGTAMIRSHYQSLAARGTDCIHCGQCETRCPFAVAVMSKMDQATQVLSR